MLKLRKSEYVWASVNTNVSILVNYNKYVICTNVTLIIGEMQSGVYGNSVPNVLLNFSVNLQLPPQRMLLKKEREGIACLMKHLKAWFGAYKAGKVQCR